MVSNRILGILVLVIFCGSIYAFIQYFFIVNKVDISFQGNVPEYQLELYAKKINKTYNYDCKLEKCEVFQLPFFDYQYTISKEGYEKLQGYIVLEEEKKIYDIEFDLKKKIHLERVENLQEVTLTSNQQKIEELREANKSYFYEKLSFGTFRLVENQIGGLDVNYNGKKITQIEKLQKSHISLFEVGEQGDIVMEFADTKYYYNRQRAKLSELGLKLPLKYVKKGNTNEVLLVTQKGTYIYNIYSQNIDYFHFFDDFVYYDEGYLGVISPDDNIRITNLGLGKIDRNVVYYYNPSTKEKKNIFESALTIEKIFLEDEGVYIQDVQGEIYELQNI